MNLYEIQHKFQAALAALDAAETETEYYDAEVTLTALDAAKDDKLEACCCHYKNLTATADSFDREIERLKALRDAAAAKAERFKKYMHGCLIEGDKWGRGVHQISWRKSEAVKITDEAAIPGAYLREILKYEPDKTQIKTDLKMGATIPGATLETKQNLQIK